jgi:hypothetical protein
VRLVFVMDCSVYQTERPISNLALGLKNGVNSERCLEMPFGWTRLSTAADQSRLTLFVEMQLCSKPTHGSIECWLKEHKHQLKNFGLPLQRSLNARSA